MGITVNDTDSKPSDLDRARINMSRTAKGWRYETTIEIHRKPGEDGKDWMGRISLAQRQLRELAVQERDDRNRMDGLQGD